MSSIRRGSALERTLAEAVAAAGGARALVFQTPHAFVPLALEALGPGAQMAYLHLDLYHVDQARRWAGRPGSAQLVCLCRGDLSGLPFAPDVAATQIARDDEAALTCEMLREAYRVLPRGAKLVAATNNPRDRWLIRQLTKLFAGVTLFSQGKEGRVYLAKRGPGAGSGSAAGASDESGVPRFHVQDVEVEFGGERLSFATCAGVFSSRGLDEGSRALLEVLEPPSPCRALLDLGCGWGALAVFAARRATPARLTLIDSNARAAEMSRRNLQRHGLAGAAQVRLEANAESLLGGEETDAYDLVVANPPYGADLRVADLFVQLAARVLSPGGSAWFVVRNNPHVAETFRRTFARFRVLRRRGYEILTAERQP